MPQDFASWHRSQIAAGLPWAHSRATALEVYESMQPPAPSPAKRQRDADIARLRSEVGTLRARLRNVERLFRRAKTGEVVSVDTLVAAVGGALSQVREEIEDRLEPLERRVSLPASADLAQVGRHGPALYDAGVWDAERQFRAGDVCTFGNAAWVARIDSRGMRPGDGSAWRLLNKSDIGHLRRVVREEVVRQNRGAVR